MADMTKKGVVLLHEPIRQVSVAIPCKNEEMAVGKTVRDVQKTLRSTNIEFEVIVIDDGSTDRTRDEAVAAGARVLVHKINMGYGNAIMDAVAIARFPVIAIMDADGTYPVFDLPRLINEATGHEMVIGSRQWTSKNTSLTGWFFRKSLYYIIYYLTSHRAPDFNSGFRVFRKGNLLNYRPILCPTFSFTTSLTLLYLLSAKSVAFLPIKYATRIGKSKVSYLKDALRTFSYVFVMANLFQVYRLSIVMIAAAALINGSIIAFSLLGLISSATQIGLHITAALVILIAVSAINSNPNARAYVQYLGSRTEHAN